jgi:hypothetical protein
MKGQSCFPESLCPDAIFFRIRCAPIGILIHIWPNWRPQTSVDECIAVFSPVGAPYGISVKGLMGSAGALAVHESPQTITLLGDPHSLPNISSQNLLCFPSFIRNLLVRVSEQWRYEWQEFRITERLKISQGGASHIS